MTENDYVKATNLVRINTALALLNDVSPDYGEPDTEGYGLPEIQLSAMRNSLARARDRIYASMGPNQDDEPDRPRTLEEVRQGFMALMPDAFRIMKEDGLAPPAVVDLLQGLFESFTDADGLDRGESVGPELAINGRKVTVTNHSDVDMIISIDGCPTYYLAKGDGPHEFLINQE